MDGLWSAAGDRGEGGGYTDLADVADHLGSARYYDSTDNGGSSFITHAGHAAMAIAAGQAEVVVISYAACPRSFPIPGVFWDGLTFPAGPGQFEIPYAPTLVASTPSRRRRHMHDFGTTPEQLAVCRWSAWSTRRATRTPLSRADHGRRRAALAGHLLALRLLDCRVLTDSGGSIVLAGERSGAQARRDARLAPGYGTS